MAEGMDVKQFGILQRIKLWWMKLMCNYKWHIRHNFDAANLQPLIIELQVLDYELSHIIEYLFLTFFRVVTEPTNMIFFIFFYEEKDSMKKFAGAYFMKAYKDDPVSYTHLTLPTKA